MMIAHTSPFWLEIYFVISDYCTCSVIGILFKDLLITDYSTCSMIHILFKDLLIMSEQKL
jgi:hypothetical protein